jgi:DNA-binding transcriptional ArsR family regulator
MAKKTIALQGCCEPVGSTRFDDADAVELADGQAGVCVCDLVEPSGRSQPTVSHHLKVLRDAGLVASERRGTWAWYFVQPERVAALKSALG